MTSITRERRILMLPALLVVLLFVAALLPAVARAAWVRTDAHIVDPFGTGYVNLLNVRVNAVAENDSTAVAGVQFSDDGLQWYEAPYDGAVQPWVLSGESGAKTLFVRFAGQDGSLSSPVQTGIIVDTVPPRTAAGADVRCRRGAAATFAFTATDAVSPRLQADIVISRRGKAVKVMLLGWIAAGSHAVTLPVKLARGAYTWKVRAMDLAHWSEDQATVRSLTVR